MIAQDDVAKLIERLRSDLPSTAPLLWQQNLEAATALEAQQAETVRLREAVMDADSMLVFRKLSQPEASALVYDTNTGFEEAEDLRKRIEKALRTLRAVLEPKP